LNGLRIKTEGRLEPAGNPRALSFFTAQGGSINGASGVPRSTYLRRRTLAPAVVRPAAGELRRLDRADTQNPPAYPARIEPDGHRHRIAHRDCNRADGRDRLCASQPFDRRPGRRDRDRKEI